MNAAVPRSPVELEAPPSADDSLELIEDLVERGQVDAARTSFYAFRAQYPYHRVADALLERMGI